MILLLKAPFCGAAEAAAPQKEHDSNETGVEVDEPVKKTDDKSAIETIVNSIIESFKLLTTRNMLLLAPLFVYSGFSLSFYRYGLIKFTVNSHQM